MTITEAFDMLPLTEKTLSKRIAKGLLPFVLKNDGGHPCELTFYEIHGVEFKIV